MERMEKRYQEKSENEMDDLKDVINNLQNEIRDLKEVINEKK